MSDAYQNHLRDGESQLPSRLSDRVFAKASRLLDQGRATEAAEVLCKFSDREESPSFEVAERFDDLATEAVHRIREIFGEISHEEYLRKLRRRNLKQSFGAAGQIRQLSGSLKPALISHCSPK